MVKELRESYGSGKTRSYEWRVSQLKNIEKMTEYHEQEIIEALRSDLSKPEFESYIQEIALLKNSCTLALKELKSWMKPEKVKSSPVIFPSSAEIVPEPLGVVLVISAWNYPLLVTLDPVVGAIAAGNAVVVKPSELAPATSSLLAKLLGDYMDNSCVRVVEGAVAETSALLEQKWDKICYTGNRRVGRIVMASAVKHLTPVLLELGGKCPAVVDSGIDLQVASRRIVVGKWGSNNGQACVAPDYMLTTKDFAPQLVEALKCELDNFFGKNPLQSKDLSRIVNSNHYARLTKLLDEEDVSDKIVHGGERDLSNLRIAPTILLDVPQDSLIMNEEVFGPLLPIVTVDKVEDSFDLIKTGTKPLTAYLFTNNKKLKDHFVRSISAGGLVINDTIVHFAVASLPFGGVGESGMGAYHGKFSFEAFSHKKAVIYRGFAGDISLRYPPYTMVEAEYQKQFSELLMKAASDYGALTASVADFQWSQTFKEPPSVWGEMLRPIPVALASCTRFFEAMSAMRESFATLQHLRVGHSDTSSPITPAKDSRRVPGVSDCVTPPPWKTEPSFDDLAIKSSRRTDIKHQEAEDESELDGSSHRRLSWPPSVKKAAT